MTLGTILTTCPSLTALPLTVRLRAPTYKKRGRTRSLGVCVSGRVTVVLGDAGGGDS